MLTVGTITTAASTELNSLANNTGALGAEQDNTGNNYQFAHFEIVFGTGSNATAGNLVKLYITSAADGTNYDDQSTAANTAQATYIGAVVCRAATSHRLKLFDVPIPVGQKWKIVCRNESGQAWNSSGNTVKYLPYKFA
jgi:hypothetical protein